MNHPDIEVTDTHGEPHKFESSDDDPINAAIIDAALVIYKDPNKPLAAFAPGQWVKWTRAPRPEPVTTAEEEPDTIPGIRTVTINLGGASEVIDKLSAFYTRPSV